MGEEVMMVFLFMIFIFGLLVWAFKKRKSQRYRKEVTDFYVASRIRQLAGEDKLDLDKEEIRFKVWAKREKLKTKDFDLDSTIEEDLIERVSEPTLKKILREPKEKSKVKKK